MIKSKKEIWRHAERQIENIIKIMMYLRPTSRLNMICQELRVLLKKRDVLKKIIYIRVQSISDQTPTLSTTYSQSKVWGF